MQLIHKLFSPDYLFGYAYSGLTRSDKIYFAAGLILLALGIFSFIYKLASKNRHKREYMQRWVNMFLTIGILVVIWFGLRYELIQGLSARIVVLFIYLWGLVWAIFILRYHLKKYRPAMNEYIKDQQRKKYM